MSENTQATNGVQARVKTIHNLPFTIPAEKLFTVGHVCTAEEASTLNQTLAENVGNNFRDTVAEVVEKAKAENRQVTPEEIAGLQAKFHEYVMEYTFAGGTRGPRGPKDEVKDVAYGLLLIHVRGIASNKGVTLSAKAIKEWQDKIYNAQTDVWRGKAEKQIAASLRDARRQTSAEMDLEAAMLAA